MLNVFRENLKSLKWVLWVVAIAMTAYLGSYFFEYDTGASGGGNWIAKIDGQEISLRDFQRAGFQIDQQYRSMFGDSYEQLRGSLQIGTRALESLIARQVMLADAEQLGLTASPEDVARVIRESPQFKTPDGQFIGNDRYTQWAQRNWGSPAAFEQAIAEDIVVERWRELVGQGTTVTDRELEELFRERTEKTAVDYVVVPSGDQDIDTEISDAEELAWYDAHTSDYERTEARRIRYVLVKRDELMNEVAIDDAAIQANYDENIDRYKIDQQRKASHILLRKEPDMTEEQIAEVRQQAEDILARAQGGEDFATLATTLSSDTVSAEKGGDLGFFGRGAMVPEFDSAVFNTPIGEFAPVTETQFGFHVILVTDEILEGTRGLDEVSEDIRRELKLRRAQEMTTERAAALRGQATTSALLETAAVEAGLAIEESLVTEDDSLRDLGASPTFLTAVFDLEVGQVTEPQPVREGLAIVTVDEVIPPGVAPLAEVRNKVRTDILNDRGRQAAVLVAEEAIASVDNLASAAESLELDVSQSGDLSPGQNIPATGGLDDAARAVLYAPDVIEGELGVLAVPAGAMMYEVTRREPFDPERFENEKGELRDEAETNQRELLIQALVQKLRDQAEILVNNEALARFNS